MPASATPPQCLAAPRGTRASLLQWAVGFDSVVAVRSPRPHCAAGELVNKGKYGGMNGRTRLHHKWALPSAASLPWRLGRLKRRAVFELLRSQLWLGRCQKLLLLTATALSLHRSCWTAGGEEQGQAAEAECGGRSQVHGHTGLGKQDWCDAMRCGAVQ